VIVTATQLKRSSVVESLPASGIRAIFDQVAALERAGEKIIRFDIGRPDFETPAFVVEAAKRALDEGFTKYVGNRGIPELQQAVSEKLRKHNGAHYDPATEILITSGGSEAVAISMFGVLEADAEVLIPEPNWPHYAACARLAGATPVSVPLDVDQGFELCVADLESRVTDRTRMVVLSSPCNPTGKVYGRAVLEELLAFARRHGLYVLADEIYEYFIYDMQVPSFAALPGAKERTILINSFSKSFAMTGWRVGYVAAPSDLVSHLNKPHQYITVCSASFAQKGAAEAYRNTRSAEFLATATSELRKRRDALLEAIQAAPTMRCSPPDGAFYFFPALPDHAPPAADAALRLLKEAHVATVPGDGFGAGYDRHLRISYGSCSPADIREGMRRIIQLLY
jgi:aspartate/methionine/tyrosine aminotransferase